VIRPVLAGLLVTAGLFGTGFGLAQLDPAPPRPGPGSVVNPAGPALPSSRPVRISIAAIDVRAPVVPVDLARDGTIGVPPLSAAGTAGWYEGGPTPGEPGASVIVGHVDDKAGPAVFYRLAGLRPGTRIEVARHDHRVAVFLVDAVREYPKSALPVDAVAGDRTRPTLRLITCGGRWRGGRIGYADNILVFSTLSPG
jgi:hypothetical protein